MSSLPAIRRFGAICAAVVVAAACGTSAASPSPAAGTIPAESPSGAPSPSTVPTPTPSPAILVDVFASPTAAPASGALPTDQVDAPAPRRPIPVQSSEWLALKASGRIALVGGRVEILPPTADPLLDLATGGPLPATRTFDTSYSRWIIEPLAYGRDAKGQKFSDRNYWNLCEAGATGRLQPAPRT
jgi:hypothetical protein